MPENLLTSIREKKAPEAKKKEKPDGFASTSIAYSRDDSGIDARIVTYHSPKTPISEQYRMIRTNLQRINPENPRDLLLYQALFIARVKQLPLLIWLLPWLMTCIKIFF